MNVKLFRVYASVYFTKINFARILHFIHAEPVIPQSSALVCLLANLVANSMLPQPSRSRRIDRYLPCNIASRANCLEIQVKPHYTQAMSYDRDLRLRACSK